MMRAGFYFLVSSLRIEVAKDVHRRQGGVSKSQKPSSQLSGAFTCLSCAAIVIESNALTHSLTCSTAISALASPCRCASAYRMRTAASGRLV